MTADQPILLIEDNPIDVDLTLRAFKKQGLQRPIIVAQDGVEALEWIPRWEAGHIRPALILIDVSMPRVGGLDVLRALKAHPTLRVIPIVVLTTSRMARDVADAYEAGANSYIVKPVDFDIFLRVTQLIADYWLTVNEPPSAGASAGPIQGVRSPS